MRKNFFLLDEFNNMIGKMISSGIIDHLTTKYIGSNVKDKNNEQFSPSQITMENLAGIFEVWAYCMFSSLIVFILEKAFSCLRTIWNRRKK